MTTIRDISEYCRSIAPYELADEWDNVGLLVGSEDAAVDTVLLALDITPEVVREASDRGAQLIVSHHPVIFDPLRELRPDNAVYQLAHSDIAALCLHTNLDRAEGGVNTALAAALELKDTALYPDDYLLTGEPPHSMSAEEFALFIKDRLGAPSVRYTCGTVTRVAVSSGGGGEGIELSDKYSFDAFVTGELKHHQYNYAVSHGIAAFDAGHYPTENIIIEPLRAKLAERFGDVSFIISERYTCPYKSV